jgi:hypothetical protein
VRRNTAYDEAKMAVMTARSMSPEDVSEFTGLPLNEILKLKDGL